ncbi:MAG: hypothetical protein HKM89_10535 [Gemmatimonadales bacterium]|nr:hypothetical protein [Gemmatimonadales bacterium]
MILLRPLHRGLARSHRTWRGLIAAFGVLIAACGGGEELAGPVSGSLAVTVNGLVAGMNAAITVTGPGGYSQALSGSQTLPDLAPGQYTVAATDVTSGTGTYSPSLASQSVSVVAGDSPAAVTVAYALATGSLAVSITGLPAGTDADITVTGPGGFAAAVTGSATLANLGPGTYTVTAATVVVANSSYEAGVPIQTVAIAAAETPAAIGVDYLLATGTLDLTVTGLPGGVDAGVTVTGPGYSASVTATTTLTNIGAGTYTIDASNVVDGATTYIPNPTTQTASVTPGATSVATVTYLVAGPSSFNLVIDGMYVTQSVQTFDGAVPLVAGRDGLLRVFVRANQTNTETPDVRIRLYDNGSLTNTFTVNAPSSAVPTSISEGDLGASWNLALPAGLIQPGLEIIADVDPGNTIVELDDGDNAFPSSGSPQVQDVRVIGPFAVRFVPVIQDINGLTGNVTSGNTDQFLAVTQQLYPLESYDADVRAPYTYTDSIPIESDNATGTWSRVLSEINALRIADTSSRYYYGVVKTSYSGGIAGIGYVPGKASVGWDRLPSGSGVAAHEWGHNWGRNHAPCGGAGNPDPFYPYPGGLIGVWGYDLVSTSLVPPTAPDIMGYCSNDWISDYTYAGVLTHIATRFSVGGTAGARRPVLLVWGRVRAGVIELEPAFELDGAPRPPSTGGRYLLEGFRADGSRLFSYAFEPESVADAPDGEAHFAFTLPVAGDRPASLRATGPGGQAVATMKAGVPGAPGLQQGGGAAAQVRSLGADRVELRWDRSQFPMVLVRDPATRQILSFARGGTATIRTFARELDLVYSDGVRSSSARVAVPGR